MMGSSRNGTLRPPFSAREVAAPCESRPTPRFSLPPWASHFQWIRYAVSPAQLGSVLHVHRVGNADGMRFYREAIDCPRPSMEGASYLSCPVIPIRDLIAAIARSHSRMGRLDGAARI